ncbi:MAG: nfi [Vampirovibrio sp.]|nr:nfi [Vampirovibrio sp.]
MGMDIPTQWLYPASLEDAAQVQRLLAEKVVREDQLPAIERIGGLDVSNNLRDPENWVYASVASLGFPALKLMETTCAKVQSTLPYMPGFLAFREVPALVEAYGQLQIKPDLLMVDGHGISHPRGLGIASHLGVLLNCPTIGVAKSILVGKPLSEPGNQVGDYVPLVWRGNTLGAVLRTRPNVAPVYISTGHKISLETAIEWVVRCLTRYRLPEPTRQAHQAANNCRKGLGDNSLTPVTGHLPLLFSDT